MKRRGVLVGLVLGVAMSLSVLSYAKEASAADKFPSREVTIVVEFSAGGPIDLTTRVLAEYLKKELGVPVVVDNQAEAGGVKGVVSVYRAKPDGYTLLSHIFIRNAQMEVINKAPYKGLELTYLAGVIDQVEFVAVRKDSPYKTVKDLVEASKKKSLNVSTTGMGSRSHLAAMVLKKNLGIDMELVPYRGSAPAMMALLGKTVDMTTSDDLTVLLHREKVLPLAIFSDRRSKKFPDVPTLTELGYKFDTRIASSLTGIAGPPNMPEGIRKTLEAALARAIKNPELVRKIEEMGPNVQYLTGEQFFNEAKQFYKLVVEFKDMLQEQK